MKKTAAYILALMLVFSMLAGCGTVVDDTRVSPNVTPNVNNGINRNDVITDTDDNGILNDDRVNDNTGIVEDGREGGIVDRVEDSVENGVDRVEDRIENRTVNP